MVQTIFVLRRFSLFMDDFPRILQEKCDLPSEVHFINFHSFFLTIFHDGASPSRNKNLTYIPSPLTGEGGGESQVGGISCLGIFDRNDARKVLEIQKKKVRIIPKMIDPNMV
jgi:hypothetical protein